MDDPSDDQDAPTESAASAADPWGLEALGAFVRSQRRLANLSLREMAERTRISNAYLSQVERGMHAPSVRVLRSIAEALDLSAEAMLTQAGLFWDEPAGDEKSGGTKRQEGREGKRVSTETVLRGDPRLTDDQKEALLSVYRSYIAGNRNV